MASNAIEVRFVAAGLDQLDRAFRSVEDRAVKLGRTNERSYSDDVRAAQRAAREKEREQARADRERERSASAAERQQIKLTEASVAAVAKAAAEKLRIEDRWARESLRFAHDTSLAKQKLLDNELRDELRARERHARAIGSMMHTSMGSAMSRTTSTLARGATGLASTALQLGGGMSIQDILEQRKALERQAVLFSNQTSTDPGGRVAASQIMAQAKATGLANNVKAIDVVGGMNAFFAKTGDVKGSMGNAGLFAQLAAATGSDLTEIGSVAGALKVQNPNLDDKAMRAMMLNIVGQTRTGAVDMKDLVAHLPVITATSALYGGDQAENQRKLIGLSQVAMRTSGSPAESATAVQNLAMDIASHADKIKAKSGFNVRDKGGQLKDASEIISQLMLASGGDVGKLQHDFGIGRRSMKLFTASEQTFKGAGGGKAGAAAVQKDIQRFENGGYTEESLKSDVDASLNTTGAKFDRAVTRIKEALEEKLAPKFEQLTDYLTQNEPKIEKFIDALAAAGEFLIEHPFAAVFALMSANLAAEIAKAAIGKAIGNALEKAAAAAGSKGINLGGSVGLMALGAVAITAEQAWIQQSIDADHAGSVARGQLQPAAASQIQSLMANPTPENLQKAQALRAQLVAAEGHVGDKSSFGQIAGWFQSGDASKKEEGENKKLALSLMDSVGKLDDAIKKATASINGSAGAANTPARNVSMSDPSRGGTK